MNRSVAYLYVFVIVVALLNACTPVRSFEKTKHPAAPDYSNELYWAALPWRQDAADSIPKGCSIPEKNQSEAEVDVFYIYPTSYLSGTNWNERIAGKKMNAYTAHIVKMQASVFNACGKVYAPRYRQAIFKSFINDKNGPKALDLAYEDVKASFEYYLAHWNKGRPFILAGHSQGSKHLERLMKELIDGKPLLNLLVAAYPIGMPVSDSMFVSIPIGKDASQTGCYISWNSYKWGTKLKQTAFFNGGTSVNPLTWKTDTVYASANMNHGGVPLSYKRMDPNICDAKNSNGILWLHKPKKGGYFKLMKSYHALDYNLFYMNLRENALLRSNTYLKAHSK